VRRGLTAGLGTEPPRSTLDSALAAFQRCYRSRLFVASRLFPGVRETLGALRARGLVVGCITNKPQAYTGALLEQAGVAGLLDFAFSGDSFDTKKPDPKPLLSAARQYGIEPSAAVMIGDGVNDRDAALAAGFGFIFAAYGYTAADDPALNRADAVIGAFSDLERLLSG
jgi:phosphoglycolate phosphatase